MSLPSSQWFKTPCKLLEIPFRVPIFVNLSPKLRLLTQCQARPCATRVDFTSSYTENHDPTRGEEMLRRHVSEKQKTKPRKVFSFNLNMCQIFVSCDVNKYC